jgi:RNA polymerase nonessential primary-like sigma factor
MSEGARELEVRQEQNDEVARAAGYLAVAASDQAISSGVEDELDDWQGESTITTDLVRQYLNEIGKTPLLSAEQEVELGKRIEAGVFAAEVLDYWREDATEAEREQKLEAMRSRRVTGIYAEAKKTNREVKPSELAAVLPDLRAVMNKPEVKPETEARRHDLAQIVRDGEVAKEHMIRANLRLVASVAKRYTGRGMSYLDLIQEGNTGLVRAIEKFDYTKGFKFSTYATWWLRQSMTRALADQGRTIRMPVHMVEQVNKLGRIKREFIQEQGREPSEEELASAMATTVDKVQEYAHHARDTISLDMLVGAHDAEKPLSDYVQDADAPDPQVAVEHAGMMDALGKVLGTLPERERQVVRMRFGIGRESPMTLDQIGRQFGVTRERIRQLEKRAMAKLKNPEFVQYLREFAG